jgi:hypothetical protein
MTSSAWLALLVSFAFLALLAWALWRLIFPAPGRPMVCATCGHHGPTKAHTRGSLAVEIVLWLALLVPGLLYSLWRVSGRRQVCTSCGSDALIPPDSPVARRLLRPDR